MKFNLSISRDNNDVVGIEVICKKSRTRFLKLELTLEEYAQVVTGLSHVEVEGQVSGLDTGGKTKVREQRTVVVAEDIGRKPKEQLEDWLIRNCSEDGWILNTYLGSQNSVVYDHPSKKYTINYSVYKYVDQEN